tara:strand:- start:7861 stop:9273 length:1413 start_codon:yes stop_codon:yes gene_type:complete
MEKLMISVKNALNQLKSTTLRELTISPDYQQRGVFNPYYTMHKDVIDTVDELIQGKDLDWDEILFKSVDKGSGTLINNFGGKFHFQIVLLKDKKEEETRLYITVPKKYVLSHRGMKQRKDSTASSNVNEFLTVYFLAHPKFKDAKQFMSDIGGMTGGTKVFTGEEVEVNYDTLRELLDRDETAERDINIGYQNSRAVKKDLGNWKKLYWTPRGKPAGIGSKNPSDVIIQIDNENFVGYSNKIAAGKDVTPKINTNLFAFFGKLGNKVQQNAIVKVMDDAWENASKKVPTGAKNAQAALKKVNIKNEKPSESASRAVFANIAREFKKDRLEFFSKDFYYNYRNELIQKLGNHLKTPKNLVYFLNTIAFYTFDDVKSTPCPYKLLVGSESGSTIKDVSSDEDMKEFLFNDKPTNIRGIKFEYKIGQQSFILKLQYKIGNYRVTIPLTTRTRTAGGWQGKSLYITTPGIKLEQ